MKRYLILNDEELVLGELAPRTVFAPPSEQNLTAEQGPRGLRSMVRDLTNEAEAEAISRALDETQWSRKRAARLLKISYKALLYKMRQYGIGETTAAKG